MPSLSPSDKAFIVAQHYAGKSAKEIQRKFKRDRKMIVSLPTVSMWMQRVETEFETSCKLERKVRIYARIGCKLPTFSTLCLAFDCAEPHLSLKLARCLKLGFNPLQPHRHSRQRHDHLAIALELALDLLRRLNQHSVVQQ